MNQLQVDPASGFVQSSSISKSTFDAEKKSKFVALAQEFVDAGKSPNLTRICKAIGIDFSTYWRHMREDPAFKKECDEIRFQLEDQLSANLVENAKRPNGVGAAAFWLKNRVPERWSDNPQTEFSQDLQWLKTALINSKTVIDAEIVAEKPQITDAK